MSRPKSSAGATQPTWPERLREIVLRNQKSEELPDRTVYHRRGILGALIGGTAAATLLAVPGRAQAAVKDAEDFKSIRTHENDHVDVLVTVLGPDARPKPNFQGLAQKKFRDFVNVAQILENTGVGAYLGAAPSIKSRQYLAAAGSIALIEARHAGFLNEYVEDPITGNIFDLTTDNAFDRPLTDDQVVAGAGVFIKDLNGGPPIAYDDTTQSDANDIAILNFALALEYLEAEFYNVNLPKFIK